MRLLKVLILWILHLRKMLRLPIRCRNHPKICILLDLKKNCNFAADLKSCNFMHMDKEQFLQLLEAQQSSGLSIQSYCQ